MKESDVCFFWPYITLCKVITSSLLSLPDDNGEPVLCPRLPLVMSPILILSVFTILVRASCQVARAPVWSLGKLCCGHHFSLLGMQTQTGLKTFIAF